MDRYHRQMLLPFIGASGQAKLAAARVLLVGCGALGCVMADQLVRAGVGHLCLVDRDVVELTNLQRQVLFDEADAREGTPKAVAAARRLRAVNSAIEIEPLVVDVHAGNIEELAGLERGGRRVDLILDGTDNVETRYLVNDVSVKHGIPWVYGACVGSEGRVMTIRPNRGPCLRCVFPQPPRAGELPTCDTAGVLGPAAAVVAALQTAASLQLLSGNESAVGEGLLTMDIWAGRFRMIDTGGRRAECECCGRGRLEFLDRAIEQSAVQLCGRNAVQIRPARSNGFDLREVARRLGAVGTVQATDFLVRCQLAGEEGIGLTIFTDGRTLVQGTNDITRARTLVSRYVGL
jgi:adenylyltransferase/sulfurtransferase